jgi:hypothetical protein
VPAAAASTIALANIGAAGKPSLQEARIVFVVSEYDGLTSSLPTIS